MRAPWSFWAVQTPAPFTSRDDSPDSLGQHERVGCNPKSIERCRRTSERKGQCHGGAARFQSVKGDHSADRQKAKNFNHRVLLSLVLLRVKMDAQSAPRNH